MTTTVWHADIDLLGEVRPQAAQPLSCVMAGHGVRAGVQQSRPHPSRVGKGAGEGGVDPRMDAPPTPATHVRANNCSADPHVTQLCPRDDAVLTLRQGTQFPFLTGGEWHSPRVSRATAADDSPGQPVDKRRYPPKDHDRMRFRSVLDRSRIRSWSSAAPASAQAPARVQAPDGAGLRPRTCNRVRGRSPGASAGPDRAPVWPAAASRGRRESSCRPRNPPPRPGRSAARG